MKSPNYNSGNVRHTHLLKRFPAFKFYVNKQGIFHDLHCFPTLFQEKQQRNEHLYVYYKHDNCPFLKA